MTDISKDILFSRLAAMESHLERWGKAEQDLKFGVEALAQKLGESTKARDALTSELKEIRNSLESPAPQEATVTPSEASVPVSPSYEEEHPPAAEDLPSTDESWELSLGITWFSRIGIVALLIGLAMAINYSFPLLPPVIKILGGWLLAGGLFFAGSRLFERFAILGRILQGGGLSLGYLCLYAMFFIPGVQLIEAHWVGWFLLMIYVSLIMTLSQRMQSQVVAVLAILFGFYTASYAGMQWVAFLSTAMLGVATGYMSWRNPMWTILSKVSFLGAAFTYLYWANHPLSPGHGVVFSATQDQQIYLSFIFVLFYLLSLLPRERGDIALGILNTLGVYILFKSTQPAIGQNGLLELGFATIHIVSLGVLSSIRPDRAPNAFSYGQLLLGLSFLGLATLEMFDGMIEIALLATEALCMGFLSRRSAYGRMLRWCAYLFWGMAWLWFFPTWFGYRKTGLVLTSLWVTLAGLAMAHWVVPKQSNVLRTFLLILASFGFYCSLTVAVTSQWLTLSYLLTGFSFMLTGLAFQLRTYRRIALVWLGIGVLHIIAVDIATLETPFKILVFLLLGGGLLGASYGYNLLERYLASQSPIPEPLPEVLDVKDEASRS